MPVPAEPSTPRGAVTRARLEGTGVEGTGVDGIDVDGIELPAVATMPQLPDGSVSPSALWEVLVAAGQEPLSDHDCLELLAAWHRLEAAITAHRMNALHRFHTTPYADDPGANMTGDVREFAADEIATRLACGRRTVERDLSTAYMLRGLPGTRAALACGRLDAAKAALIADTATSIEDSLAAEFEQRVVDRAVEQNPAGLRRTLNRTLLALDAEAVERRHRRAAQDRYVSGTPASDGMADLHAHLTGYDWIVINSALNAAARGMKNSGDERTMDQLRADALIAPFLKALHTGTLDGLTPIDLARHHGRPIRINVTVPASMLLGLSNAPGHLDGYGPIPAGLARRLATDGQWFRILTDPLSGAAVDVGTTRYAPPESLARLVEIRDGTCRFPGCHARAEHGDLDHTIPYPRGRTSHDNLGALCRRHHRMKHEAPGIALVHDDAGHFSWRMPTGQSHAVAPPRLTEPDDPLIRSRRWARPPQKEPPERDSPDDP